MWSGAVGLCLSILSLAGKVLLDYIYSHIAQPTFNLLRNAQKQIVHSSLDCKAVPVDEERSYVDTKLRVPRLRGYDT